MLNASCGLQPVYVSQFRCAGTGLMKLTHGKGRFSPIQRRIRDSDDLLRSLIQTGQFMLARAKK